MRKNKKIDQGLYQIENFDKIDPFLMTLTSSEDYWMYISSTGSLTAGKKNPETCLFPYETVDNLHKNAHSSGPITIIKVKVGEEVIIWEPFSQFLINKNIKRNLYKNCTGNTIIFEEINKDLKLTFRYQWNISKNFGFVKKTTLINDGNHKQEISVLDGFQNIMAAGIELQNQQTMSNLSNAYRYSELLEKSKCALYTLTSLLMDTPKPGESLYANVVWALSDFDYKISLSSDQIKLFKKNMKFNENHLVTGEPGAFLINFDSTIESKDIISWEIVSDVKKDQISVSEIDNKVSLNKNLRKELFEGIKLDSDDLENYIGNSDGFQCTEISINDMHHTANVLYNVMRGGILNNNYKIDKNDFHNFIKIRNKILFDKYIDQIQKLNNTANISDLINFAEEKNDLSLIRLCYSYLPITFGRRHGDPSRPWNHFEIIIKDQNDKQRLYYEGNWRDIFQNWEALSLSYPLTLESMLSIFINNCTVDGFNPFRVTSEGIDWDVLEPENNWSYIGYWNDHQIIYLLKFLEHISKNNKNILLEFLTKSIFSYANVPYKIKNIDELIKDPKQTIEFDFEKNEKIMKLVENYGTDGKLVLTDENEVYHVNLCEKLLVMILAKISNFIPGGGIWLNTQRPEWNDANNALVGYGISMVTTYYLRRFLCFYKSLLLSSDNNNFLISSEVISWLQGTHEALKKNTLLLNNDIIESNKRMAATYDLGTSFSSYRARLYDHGFSGLKSVKKNQILNFIDISLKYVEHTISINENKNKLYNSYNIIKFSNNNNSLDIDYLEEMLEGQVAVLSSGYLSTKKSIKLLESLYQSKIYRKDQNSFMLYPMKEVKSFMQKNKIPKELINKSNLLKQMIKDEDRRIIAKDVNQDFRFNPDFINISYLEKTLNDLEINNYSKKIIDTEKLIIIDIYEQVFKHKYYTGRSSNMFAYEGIGSIYWHMVSKLLLAVQEVFLKSVQNEEDIKLIQQIGDYYYKIRSGLSADKSPEEYGAFPFDAYSHTPYKSGAKQPGMTGQVKEEIITRMGELGCFVSNGQIIFNPLLLRKSEFLTKSKQFYYFDVLNKKINKKLAKDSLCYTYCQIPILYQLSEEGFSINIQYKDGKNEKFNGNKIKRKISNYIFKRNDIVREICVKIPKDILIFK